MFLEKSHEITDFGPLRIGQDSEFAQFSPRALLMSKLTKVLPLACLKRYFLNVLQTLSEFV